MSNVVDLRAVQRLSALERANEKRSAIAQYKRGLKSGTVELAAALEAPELQDRSALEVLGYACIGKAGPRYGGQRSPKPAGLHALQVARTLRPPIGHTTKVGDLSAARRLALCAALDSSGYAAAAASRSSSA